MISTSDEIHMISSLHQDDSTLYSRSTNKVNQDETTIFWGDHSGCINILLMHAAGESLRCVIAFSLLTFTRSRNSLNSVFSYVNTL